MEAVDPSPTEAGQLLRNFAMPSSQPRLLSSLGTSGSHVVPPTWSVDGYDYGGAAFGNCTPFSNDTDSVLLCDPGNYSLMLKTTTPLAGFVSQYNLPLTIFLAVLAGATSIVTVLGNLLVLVSFVLDRQIRQPANYFIASLAVTDFLIGLFSMPLYTMYLLLGFRWPLGTIVCDLWLSLDYTVCLTSQYTVFFITLDRFCSVSYPARYRAWRTEKKLKIMVLLTWLLPAFIFYVSIIGWPYFVGVRTVPLDMCYVQFMENPLFNTALVISYYWTTLVVITVLYVGIYRIALQMARKSQAKRKLAENVIQAAAGGARGSVGQAAKHLGHTPTKGSGGLDDVGAELPTQSGLMVEAEATSHFQTASTSGHQRLFSSSSTKRVGTPSGRQSSPRKSDNHQSDDTPSEGSDHPTPKRSTRSALSTTLKAANSKSSGGKMSFSAKRQSYKLAKEQSRQKTSETSLTMAGEISVTEANRRTSSSNYSGESPQSRAGASTSATPSPAVGYAPSSTIGKRASVGWFRIKLMASVFRRMRPLNAGRPSAPTIHVEQVPLVDRASPRPPNSSLPIHQSSSSTSALNIAPAPLKKAFDPSDFGGIYLGPTAEKYLQAQQQKDKKQQQQQKEAIEDSTSHPLVEEVVGSDDEPDAGEAVVITMSQSLHPPEVETHRRPASTISFAPSRSTSLKLDQDSLDDGLSSQSQSQTLTLTTTPTASNNVTPLRMAGTPSHGDDDSSEPTPRASADFRRLSLASQLPDIRIDGPSQSMRMSAPVSRVPSPTPSSKHAAAPLATPQSTSVSTKGFNNKMTPGMSTSALSNLSSTAIDSERGFDGSLETVTRDLSVSPSVSSHIAEGSITSDSTLTSRPPSLSIATQVNSNTLLRAAEREKYNRAVRPPKLDILIRAPPEALCGIRWADSESVLSFNSQDTVRILPEYLDEISMLSGSISTVSRDSEPSSPVWIRRNSGHKMSTLHCLHELPEHGPPVSHDGRTRFEQSRRGFQPVPSSLPQSQYSRQPKIAPQPPPPSGWNRRLRFYNRHFAGLNGMEQLQVSVIPASLDDAESSTSSRSVSPALKMFASANNVPDTETAVALPNASTPTPTATPTAATPAVAAEVDVVTTVVTTERSTLLLATIDEIAPVAATPAAAAVQSESVKVSGTISQSTTLVFASSRSMTAVFTTEPSDRDKSPTPTTTSPTTEQEPTQHVTVPLLAAAAKQVDLLLARAESCGRLRLDTNASQNNNVPKTSTPTAPSNVAIDINAITPSLNNASSTNNNNNNNNNESSESGKMPRATSYQQRLRIGFIGEMRQLIFGRRSTAATLSGDALGTPTAAVATAPTPVHPKQRRSMRKTENRATKALRTITFILGAFVLTWTPYHIFAIIKGFCNDCVDDGLYSISYWLCYVASPLNPFCYAFANQQFKKAFLRILRCDFRSY